VWDNADYDDVVILATSSTGTTDAHPQSDLTRLLVVVAPVARGVDGPLPAAFPSRHPSRAPPAA
jgi:hypothetical protein